MKQYLELLQDVLDNGVEQDDRTGTGTISVFGRQVRYDLQEGFPLVTTKKVFTKGVIHELIWFLSGDTNTKYLTKNGVKIWDEWADPWGGLGPVYGAQWRSWWDYEAGRGIDQIQEVIESIKTSPHSRRHIVSAWNVGEIPEMALPPCHLLFQFYVSQGKLSLQLYQRSADLFLGVPFNIASYALLLHMVATQTGYEVGEFIHTIGDAHIYKNHIDQVKKQLTREPKKLPKLLLDSAVTSINGYEEHHVSIVDYDSHPTIRGEVSV